MLKYPDIKESEGLPEFLLALCTKKLQVKKDHLLGLREHEVQSALHPYVWMLAEYAKEVLFEGEIAFEPTF